MNSMIFLSVLAAVAAALLLLLLVHDLRDGGRSVRTGGDAGNEWHPSLPSRPYGASVRSGRRRG